MRVLVIGGTVFIGRAVVAELTGAGHDVAVFHRGESEPDGLAACTHIHGNRNEIAASKSEIAAFAPDVVVDNIAAFKSHAEGVTAALGDGVRYVVVSSIDVYRAYGALHAGTVTDPMPITESSPVREERHPYRGQIEGMDDYDKLDVEEVYRPFGATVLRLPMVYGPHDRQRREEFVLRRVRAKRQKIPVGSGTWLGAKGFVSDIGRGIRLGVEKEGVEGEIFNLCETTTYPEGMWVRMILEAAGSGAEVVTVPDDKLPADMGMTGAIGQHLMAYPDKAMRVLGFTDTDPREALKASVEWHLANPPTGEDPGFDADDEALAAAVG